MPPPAVVYVVAAVVGVAAVFAFKEFVYEPHLAPKIEAWAEGFLERRRAVRNRRASAVPVRSSRRPSTPSVSSHDDDDQGDQGEGDTMHRSNNFALDEFELEALASKEVDEWRNEVLRSQERTNEGLRKRRASRFQDDFDGLDSTSTTLDESFTTLTHTPLTWTHVISNVSSPLTPSTMSLPQTPTRRVRSVSQSTARDDATASLVAPHSSAHEIAVMSPRVTSPDPISLTPRLPADANATTPLPIAIPIADHLSPATEGVPHPLPFTPTYQVVADDSPFGPLLQDTPRSSAEMYGERPFSPITRVLGSSSGHSSAASSKGSLSSSTRTLGSSGVLRKSSGLINEVVVNGSDDGSDEEGHPQMSASTLTLTSAGPEMNGSVVSSLSERYPAAPTPPVIVSPAASSIGVISTPSSPRSGSSEVVVHLDAMATEPHTASSPLRQTLLSPPLLQLPPDSSSPRLASRQSSAHSVSPALSYASFLSPMPVSRAASGSEGDEFMSVASDDSDWNSSPVRPGRRTGPVHDRAHNPFLDFEYLSHSSERGSEESEVLIVDAEHEGESEVGSDESWGSARRH